MVYLYVLDTLADWEISYITAELNSGRYFKEKGTSCHIIKISHSLDAITTMGGICIQPDETLESVKFQAGDMLILPGADTWFDAKNDKVLDLASRLIESGLIIAAICGATFALANKGLLNSRKHTSNDKDYLKSVCANYSGESFFINEPAVVDNNLITASGIAPLEFAYEVFKKTEYFSDDTLTAWYNLFKTQKPQYFFDLMNSLS